MEYCTYYMLLHIREELNLSEKSSCGSVAACHEVFIDSIHVFKMVCCR